MLVWNTETIFARAGGTLGVIKLCTTYAHGLTPPNYNAVAVWKHRAIIPGAWAPVVVYGLLQQDNLPTNFDEMFTDRVLALGDGDVTPSLEELGL